MVFEGDRSGVTHRQPLAAPRPEPWTCLACPASTSARSTVGHTAWPRDPAPEWKGETLLPYPTACVRNTPSAPIVRWHGKIAGAFLILMGPIMFIKVGLKKFVTSEGSR